MPGSSYSERRLDLLNILLSDVRYGLGAYLGVYLLENHHWDEATIGLALSIGGLAGLLASTPMGALVDAVRDKRWLIAAAAIIVTATCLAIPLAPRFGPVVTAGVVGGIVGSLFLPAVAAISLGMVGHARFAARAGRNEAMFHAGNAGCNIAVLIAAAFVGNVAVFWVLALTALASVGAAIAIPKHAIDPDLARGFIRGAADRTKHATPLRALLSSRPLASFALCNAVFTLANGAMLGLVGQKLSLLVPGQGIALTAGCAIAAQIVMVPTAMFAGKQADRFGRKPLYIAAFVALAVRGALYTVSDAPAWLVAVQLLDGVGAGLTGALLPVVVADLTRGSGHFAVAQAGTATFQGIGMMVSTTLAGTLVVEAGYSPTFLTLAAIAAIGGIMFWYLVPETRPDAAADGPAVVPSSNHLAAVADESGV